MKQYAPDRIYTKFQRQVVHVRINPALIDYLRHGVRQKEGTLCLPSVRMSKRIRRLHREHYHEELRITEHSLALEILIHTSAYLFCDFCFATLQRMGLSKEHKLCRFFDYIRSHARDIDCGEKIQDTNRFVFDGFSHVRFLAYPFFRLCLWLFPVQEHTKKE